MIQDTDVGYRCLPLHPTAWSFLFSLAPKPACRFPTMAKRAYQNVKFKAVDGVYLRGRLYAAAQRGPAVIMSPGVSDSFKFYASKNDVSLTTEIV